MELSNNKAIEITARINDAFYNLQVSKWVDEEYFNERETANNFTLTTDFRTMAEAVPFIKFVSLRYNWQMKVSDKFNMLIVLNLN